MNHFPIADDYDNHDEKSALTKNNHNAHVYNHLQSDPQIHHQDSLLGTIKPNEEQQIQQQQQHLGASRQYWRDILLGVNDGMISTYLLMAGVVGSQMDSREILLTAVSGSLAGAVSMFSGEFVATKSQNDVMVGEISLEKFHILNSRDSELNELKNLLPLIGVTDSNLQRLLIQHYSNHDDDLLKIMKTLEFGMIDDEIRSPMKAGLVSGSLFFLGSIPSMLPFIYIVIHQGSSSSDVNDHDTTIAHYGFLCSTICTILSLLLVGAIKSWCVKRSCSTPLFPFA